MTTQNYIYIADLIVGLALTGLWISGIVSCVKQKKLDPTMSVAWFFVVILLPVIGTCIYFFVFKNKARAWTVVGLMILHLILIGLTIMVTIKTIGDELKPTIETGDSIKIEWRQVVLEKFERFEDEKFNFQIDYPNGGSSQWATANFKEITYYLENAEKTASGSITISEGNLEKDETLETYTQKEIDEIKLLDNYKLIESSNTTLAGQPAKKLVYTSADDTGEIQTASYLTIKEGEFYRVKYKILSKNFNEFTNILDRMLNSMVIKDTGNKVKRKI